MTILCQPLHFPFKHAMGHNIGDFHMFRMQFFTEIKFRYTPLTRKMKRKKTEEKKNSKWTQLSTHCICNNDRQTTRLTVMFDYWACIVHEKYTQFMTVFNNLASILHRFSLQCFPSYNHCRHRRLAGHKMHSIGSILYNSFHFSDFAALQIECKSLNINITLSSYFYICSIRNLHFIRGIIITFKRNNQCPFT